MPTASIPRTLQARIRLRALRYAFTLIGPSLALVGFLGHGWWCWGLPLHGFVLIPILELILPPKHMNLAEDEATAAMADPLFDLLLYAIVPIQWALLVVFLFTVDEVGLSTFETLGRVVSMGLLCGVYGINVAHELGHRATRWERDLSRALLLSSLYMHFIIEHNRGHHRRVGTPEDPASARFGENIYFFWVRTIVYSFISAWRIEADRLKKEGVATFGAHNEMIRFLLIEVALLAVVFAFFGGYVMVCFIGAALIGILLLETVNYIEHYGLGRVRNANGGYGRVQHYHSWNSDHPIGRLMLFELTRHSDHHWKASKKYQVLDSVQDGPQLPTGYPGMMILSLIPPLWFAVTHPLIRAMAARHADLALAKGRANAANGPAYGGQRVPSRDGTGDERA